MKFDRRYVEKPWGRMRLPSMFNAPQDARIGEVWFTGDGDLPLLTKYIFTSEPLSIQVHPDDQQARARGLGRGKSECWYILDAEPDATIGLGLKNEVSAEELRNAAIDGSIEALIDWRPIAAGDFFFVPAGTIHAIGAGISLLEFQQNSDVTYRLYDYGRPRELHLDDAVDVGRRAAYPNELAQRVGANEELTLVERPFTLVHTRQDALSDRQRWVMPLDGTVESGDDVAAAGECLLLEPGDALKCDAVRMLIGATA